MMLPKIPPCNPLEPLIITLNENGEESLGFSLAKSLLKILMLPFYNLRNLSNHAAIHHPRLGQGLLHKSYRAQPLEITAGLYMTWTIHHSCVSDH